MLSLILESTFVRVVDNFWIFLYSLFAELNYFKNKFIRLIKFIKNRLFNRKDRDKYRDFSRDLYEHGVIEDDTIKELNETYKFSKKHDSIKEKDDYDIEI